MLQIINMYLLALPFELANSKFVLDEATIKKIILNQKNTLKWRSFPYVWICCIIGIFFIQYYFLEIKMTNNFTILRKVVYEIESFINLINSFAQIYFRPENITSVKLRIKKFQSRNYNVQWIENQVTNSLFFLNIYLIKRIWSVSISSCFRISKHLAIFCHFDISLEKCLMRYKDRWRKNISNIFTRIPHFNISRNW